MAKTLEIEKGDPLNQRVVRLFGEKTLVHATSFSPLSRLEKKFREDIMKTNIPIGKIMEMHSMESRREILGFDWFRAGTDFGNVFEVSRDTVLLKRNYNIIHKEKPLINITEVFPYNLTDGLI
jgi:beta-ribofuranosylaminobenzene 5'-phosphate synthase